MRATIGERIYGLILCTVPALAVAVLSPDWTTSQAAVGDPTDTSTAEGDELASGDSIMDLSDWNYTANPMSPNGKTSFNRILLSSTQPGAHPTPAGPNPRVPWLTQPESQGDPNFATPSLQNLVAPMALTVNAAPANLTNPSSTTAGNSTPSTSSATPASFTVPAPFLGNPTFGAPQNTGSARSSAFQPVKSRWQDRATRLGSSGN